ncbi:MAG: hypothetical protein LBH10_00925, partial [Burkholderiaceae bacterium]|nr:hypothetical protein [Burkholderiaceae bacterium]
MPPAPASHHAQPLRVVTYNIHKGVQGFGPVRRLEIHNLALAIEMLDADMVCLQEVRDMSHRHQYVLEEFAQVLEELAYPLPYIGPTSLLGALDGIDAVAYLSRYPVSEVSDLGGVDDWPIMRKVQRYKVTFPGNVDVWFYGCHIISSADPDYAE